MGDLVTNMIKLGMIGFSKENGHPYSFSAIINGYNKESMAISDWPGIYSYLEKKDPSDFLLGMARVTHIWTQDINESRKIAACAMIDYICVNADEMIGQVDGVIIARDDYSNHYRMAKPFLQAGLKVFIDKPLSINLNELNFFKPYLFTGSLMSCSGLRYCCELDEVRQALSSMKGSMKLIRGTVINSWEKYGIHMLDAIFSVVPFEVIAVRSIPCNHFSATLKNKDHSIIQIDALGNETKTFHLDFWGHKLRFSVEIEDNFTAFKRTLYHFIQMIQSGKPTISPQLTIDIMNVLIAANISIKENREVFLDELTL